MDIDLVYLWVDGQDDTWAKKKAQALALRNNETISKDSVDKCRFKNNDELKYSLRSAQKYAPWIRNIFIVTDNQCPPWLNTDNPKIKLINQEDIMPADCAPIFNSCAIETCLSKIEGLSEHFIYANDDMFFWNKIEPSFFFDENKNPIYIMGKRILNRKYRHQYGYTIFSAYNMIKNKYGISVPYFPHHGIDPYKKSYMDECINEFEKDFKRTTYNRFRSFDDVQRVIFSYYAIAVKKCRAVYPKLSFFSLLNPEKGYINCKTRDLKKCLNSLYPLMCINEGRKTKPEDIKYMKMLLENKFPDKSEYEKA